MLSNRYQNDCLMRSVSVLPTPLQGVHSSGTCLSKKSQIHGKSILGSSDDGNRCIPEAILSRIRRLRLRVRLAYGVLRQGVLKVYVGFSLFNPPDAILEIKQKLTLADTRIIDVARMLKTTMYRVEVPPMSGNDATAQTHPAFVFNIGMGKQEFAEFNR